MKSNAEVSGLSYAELLKLVPIEKADLYRKFVTEMNRREKLVRFDKTETFESFTHKPGTEQLYGYGFKVGGQAVPYFHPNRTFHDEVIWLNENLYYNESVCFEDRLINSCLVKFYGPSNTLRIMSRDTGIGWVSYKRLVEEKEYRCQVMENLHRAVNSNSEKIFGTTELRTSLQTASRNYTRVIETEFDRKHNKFNPTRSGRSGDIFYWFTLLGPKFVEFYKTKPTMEQSFNFLSSFGGIGNYYGYHLSSNLARMPYLGTLLEKDAETGNLDEDDDYIATGVGAMNTVQWFLDGIVKSPNRAVGDRMVNAIKRDQKSFICGNSEEDWNILKDVSEIERFTTFGCEISLCQFSVFLRLRENSKLALKRALAPISQESEEKCVLNEIVQLSLF